MTPLFIEVGPDRYVNATQIGWVSPKGSTECTFFAIDGDGPCGSGNCTSQEFVARVNNALALVQMIEKAAT